MTITQAPRQLLSVKEVCDLLGGIARPTLYRGIKSGRYPPPIKLGPAISRWRRDEIEAVIQRASQARAPFGA